MILDNGERLEGLAQPDAVGDDAATEAVKFVERSDHSVTLEPVEFLPDYGVVYTGRRLEDSVLVEIIVAITKNVVQD